jgi:predicted RNase H-like nuclease (RuvC/YqgF family)
MNHDNLRLGELIETLTAMLGQNMHTTLTDVSSVKRDNGIITLTDENAVAAREEVDRLEYRVASLRSDLEYSDREIARLEDEIRWLKSENDRLTIERRTLLTA